MQAYLDVYSHGLDIICIPWIRLDSIQFVLHSFVNEGDHARGQNAVIDLVYEAFRLAGASRAPSKKGRTRAPQGSRKRPQKAGPQPQLSRRGPGPKSSTGAREPVRHRGPWPDHLGPPGGPTMSPNRREFEPHGGGHGFVCLPFTNRRECKHRLGVLHMVWSSFALLREG